MLVQKQPSGKGRAERSAHAALVVLLIAIATNVALALTLKGRIDALNPTPKQVGQVITEIVGTDESGSVRNIALIGDRPTLVYFSRRGCTWCERNQANVDALGLQASARYRIVELSPEDERPVGRRSFGVERFGVADDVMARFGAHGTPYTFLLSQEGRIISAWAGAFGPRLLPTINQTLDVELPGIVP